MSAQTLSTVLLLLVAACLGSVGCDGPRTNGEACENYVTKSNTQFEACGYDNLKTEVADTCPNWMNFGGADCTDYYDCLEMHSTCCTAEVQAELEQSGETCELNTINFAAMEGCTGCK